jgi:hypothetical protein
VTARHSVNRVGFPDSFVTTPPYVAVMNIRDTPLHSRRWHAALAVAVALSLPVVACSGGSSSPKAATSSTSSSLDTSSSSSTSSSAASSVSSVNASGSGATLHATFTFTGSIPFTGDYQVGLANLDSGQGCSSLATSGTEGSGGVPPSPPKYLLPNPGGAVNGHQLAINLRVDGLHGAGDYTTATAGDIIIDAESGAGGNDFGAPDDASAGKVTLNANGSGKLVFANWLDMGGSGATLSGELDWTCSA